MEQLGSQPELVLRDAEKGPSSPSMGHVVVWIVALVALGMMGGAWRSSLSGLGDQAAVADVEAFEAGVEGFRAAVEGGDAFLAESHVQSLMGLAASPATNGDEELDDAWLYGAAVAGRADDGELADPGFADAVLSELEGAAARLREAVG